MTNHLGNVLATVSDRKFGVSSAGSSLIHHYDPHIVTAQDYYPFGMISRVALPNNNVPYKFGFNGKMNDNEVKGLGNQQDYGMRISDPRIGRFLSVDPLTKGYPELTPYQFAGNSPMANIDLDGGEPKPAINGTQEGQSQSTSQDTYNARGDYTGTKTETWYWHSGGLRDAKGNLTKAGWYGSGGYVNVLSTSLAAKSLGSSLGLYNSAAKSLSGNEELNKKELDRFVGSGLNYEAARHFTAAAKATANSSNSFVSGKIEPSNFNVEDLLGVGMLLRGGLRFLGGIAARNRVMPLVGFGSDKAIIQNSANLISKKGWYDAVVHGTEDGMAFTINKKIVSPQELYNHMLANGYKPGTKIRLMSCYSGNFPNGAAAQLQKIAGVQVVAPTGELSIMNKGSFMVNYGQQFYVAPTKQHEVGKMLLFE
ncbi:RHS repeat domain-containing protein [Longitalea luteola]|uniref:RHS repeat domain-containing protein n=1 Tax=Longitalea luteola TaxID=2812563 RepID=UPI001A971DFA|nr:RHS repeat-associated core domain-containing protein [Longitalea luteola]